MYRSSPHGAAARTVRLALLTLALCGSSGVWLPADAQMKVGSNPTTLAGDANLQVEASDGKQVVVRKSTAQVGIGTSSPANNLEVNSGTANASGVRITQLPSAGFLGTNANGDIIKSTSAAACTCGDIKASILGTNHGDWKLMNGGYSAGSCGAPVVDASNAVLVMGGTAGTASSATPLAQNQLPNIAPAVTVTAASAGTPSGTVTVANTTATMQNAGNHQHMAVASWWGDFAYSPTWNWNASFAQGGNQGNNAYSYDGAYTNGLPDSGATTANGAHTHTMDAHTHTATFAGSAMANHAHTATASSINGGVTPSALSTSNLPRISVNYFICIN